MQTSKTSNLLLACLLLCTPFTAHAADAAAASIGDISRVQSETLLLNAQVKRAEAAQNLTAKTQPPSIRNGALPASATNAQALPPLDLQMEPPVVRMVYGKGTKLYATFVFQNGVMMDAKQGDVLLGGYIADVISVDRVEVTKGKQRYPVGFAASFPTSPQPQQQGQSYSPTSPLSTLPPGFAPSTFTR